MPVHSEAPWSADVSAPSTSSSCRRFVAAWMPVSAVCAAVVIAAGDGGDVGGAVDLVADLVLDVLEGLTRLVGGRLELVLDLLPARDVGLAERAKVVRERARRVRCVVDHVDDLVAARQATAGRPRARLGDARREGLERIAEAEAHVAGATASS